MSERNTGEYVRVEMNLNPTMDFGAKAGFLTPNTIREHQAAHAQVEEWLDNGDIQEYDGTPDTVYCMYFTAKRVTPKAQATSSAPRSAAAVTPVETEETEIPS